MRTLTVLGLTEDSAELLCEEPESGERFTVPTDERLRTVLRGVIELPAAGSQPQQSPSFRRDSRETTVDPQLRPRDIQDRIRAGASMAEVAAEAGVDESRIDTFAYPVLMERGSMAERARRARTMVAGAPSDRTVDELAMRTLSARGQAVTATWDAYREETGSWVLTLTWFAGHSDNVARWSIHPGGSTVSPLDDAATDLLDPAPRPLRRVPETAEEPAAEVPVHPMVLRTDEQPIAAEPPADPTPEKATVAANAVAAALANHAVRPSAKTPPPVARTGTDDARDTPTGTRGGGKKPSMPSWDDVLLGVRSQK